MRIMASSTAGRNATTRIRIGAAALAAALAVLVLSTGTAAAHAELMSMTPADGVVLQSPPATVVLRFSEAMQQAGTEVAVTAPSGTSVSDRTPDIVDGVVTQRLGTLTEPGRYQIAARVVSADGHPVTATGTFTIRAAAAGSSTPVRTTTTDKSSSSGPVLVVAAVVALVGAALTSALVRRWRAARS